MTNYEKLARSGRLQEFLQDVMKNDAERILRKYPGILELFNGDAAKSYAAWLQAPCVNEYRVLCRECARCRMFRDDDGKVVAMYCNAVDNFMTGAPYIPDAGCSLGVQLPETYLEERNK